MPSNAVSEHVVQFSEKGKHPGKPDGNASRPPADPSRGTCLPAIGLSTIIVYQLPHKKRRCIIVAISRVQSCSDAVFTQPGMAPV